MNKKIVVFAGNECRKDREKYYFPLAYKTGKLLAEASFVVVTGGGPGLMNEISRGAYENKGETIGVCLNLKGRKQSQYLTSKLLFDKLNPRQEKLLELGDGFIALPGGIGTLYEITAILALKRKGEIPEGKPLILIDGFYQEYELLLKKIAKEGFLNHDFGPTFLMLDTPEKAVEKMEELLV